MPQSQSQTSPTTLTVFTGDLVASSRLTPQALAEAMQALEQGAGALGRLGVPAPRFAPFRGDSWQCLGPAPGLALRGALLMRAHLGALGRPFDTRISVGVGNGWLPEAGLNLASGPAFELSGKGLDGLEHARRLAIFWERPPAEAALVRAIMALADEISRKWTPGQARVFARLLAERPRPSQEALARSLGITQQSIAEHLAGGGDWALQEALRAVEGE